MKPSDNPTPTSNRYAAWLVAAAFIGPGTVTTASIAGASFSFHVLWALIFSVFATWILQDMAVRLGVVTRQGLSEAIHHSFNIQWLRWLISALVIGAIGIGNAAYEGGNLTGAALGLHQLTGLSMSVWIGILTISAGFLLWFGHYKLIERALVGLVLIMSVLFIITVAVASPDWSALIASATQPRFDSATFIVVLALIGTTIVPYNLFLHASLVSRFEGEAKQQLQVQRKQTGIAVVVGGLITLAIMTTASAAFFQSGETLEASNIANQLAPLLGPLASEVFAIGFFAAGLTSAITAPLAAGYAVCGALRLDTSLTSKPFRIVWVTVMCSGAAVASFGFKPLAAMLFAQATNGLLLPIIAIFLLVAMNNKERLGEYRNNLWMNIMGTAIVLFTLALGLRKFITVF